MNADKVIAHVQFWGSLIVAHVNLGIFAILPGFAWWYLGVATAFMVAAGVRLVTMP